MGIDIIKVNNRRVVSYRLPSIYKKVNNNIGNKLEDLKFFKYWAQAHLALWQK